MILLNNTANVEGMLGENGTYDSSTVDVEVPALKVDKTSNATDGVWVGDELTYTITLTNIDAATQITGLTFEDVIDTQLAVLVEDSVTVNNQPLVMGTDFTYAPTTGLLEIPGTTAYTMPAIDPEESYTVTFRVTKA